MNNIDEYKEKTFDDIKHLDELGNEYWEAREFMLVLGYLKWGNISNNNVFEHFADARKVLEVGNK